VDHGYLPIRTALFFIIINEFTHHSSPPRREGTSKVADPGYSLSLLRRNKPALYPHRFFCLFFRKLVSILVICTIALDCCVSAYCIALQSVVLFCLHSDGVGRGLSKAGRAVLWRQFGDWLYICDRECFACVDMIETGMLANDDLRSCNNAGTAKYR